jgi:hypothetical protein
MGTSIGFNELANELILSIASFLNVHDTLALGLVSRRFGPLLPFYMFMRLILKDNKDEAATYISEYTSKASVTTLSIWLNYVWRKKGSDLATSLLLDKGATFDQIPKDARGDLERLSKRIQNDCLSSLVKSIDNKTSRRKEDNERLLRQYKLQERTPRQGTKLDVGAHYKSYPAVLCAIKRAQEEGSSANCISLGTAAQ